MKRPAPSSFSIVRLCGGSGGGGPSGDNDGGGVQSSIDIVGPSGGAGGRAARVPRECGSKCGNDHDTPWASASAAALPSCGGAPAPRAKRPKACALMKHHTIRAMVRPRANGNDNGYGSCSSDAYALGSERASGSPTGPSSEPPAVIQARQRAHVLHAVRWLERAQVAVCAIERLEQDLAAWLEHMAHRRSGAPTEMERKIDAWLRDCVGGLRRRVDGSFGLLSQSTCFASEVTSAAGPGARAAHATSVTATADAAGGRDYEDQLAAWWAAYGGAEGVGRVPVFRDGARGACADHLPPVRLEQSATERRPREGEEGLAEMPLPPPSATQLSPRRGGGWSDDGHWYSKRPHKAAQNNDAFVEALRRDLGITATPYGFMHNHPASKCSHCSKVIANTTRGWKAHAKKCVGVGASGSYTRTPPASVLRCDLWLAREQQVVDEGFGGRATRLDVCNWMPPGTGTTHHPAAHNTSGNSR